MTEPERRRYNVGAVKIPFEQRDVVHDVLADGDRGWRDILGADTPDDDVRHPVGVHVAYTMELTAAEAEQFQAASNCRYVELDLEATVDRAVGRPAGTAPVPTLNTLAHMRMRTLDLRRWHGRDVRVAVIDQGTTAAVRDAMGFTLVARTITSGATMPAGRELFADSQNHGCTVAPNAVPAGGLLLDALVVDAAGTITTSSMAAAITWAADNGAKVANMSISFTESPGKPENYQQAILDAVIYANGFGMQLVFSAGNDDQADLNYPASICRTRTNVHSSTGWDEATDRRGLYSNYHADGSGCASGTAVTSMTITGTLKQWSGTSASAPHMAQLIARGATGGTYTTAQVAAALRANPRDTGAGASQQGKGAWDLHRALAALGGVPGTPTASGAATIAHVDTRGIAGNSTGYTLSAPSTAQPDDVRVAVVVSSLGAGIVIPDDWQLLTDAHYDAEWELAASQAVSPVRVRVLAHTVTDPEPASTFLGFGGASWFSAVGTITLRGAGGLDPEQFVPLVRFGTGTTPTTVPVLPRNTDDLLIVAFAQRHPAALTGTLSTSVAATRGFFRPSVAGTTTGYTLLIGTQQLASGARTAAHTATSNDSTGTWASVAFTVPASAQPLATVSQANGTLGRGQFLSAFAHGLV